MFLTALQFFQMITEGLPIVLWEDNRTLVDHTDIIEVINNDAAQRDLTYHEGFFTALALCLTKDGHVAMTFLYFNADRGHS